MHARRVSAGGSRLAVLYVVPSGRRPPAALADDASVCAPDEAGGWLVEHQPEVLVLCGVVTPEAVASLRDRAPGVPVVAVPDTPTVEGAVAALRAGAADYVADPGALAGAVARARAAVPAERVPDGPARQGFHPSLTRSPRMLRVFDAVRAVARTDATVLVRGEPGTGAAEVARAVHALGRRAAAPFVRVPCAPLGDAVSIEIFGGSDRRGALLRADRGTLFLDELVPPPMDTQLALLRALDDQRVRRSGGADPVRVDVRVVAATHLDLAAAVAEGRLREDLYYRLDVFPIQLPALRERPEDIPLLLSHFLADAARAHGLPTPAVTPDALAALQRYRWPGNVRQLRALTERWVIQLGGEPVDLACLPADLLPADVPPDPGAVVVDDTVPLATLTERMTRQLERAYLHKLLTRCGGHLQNTAAAAGITRRTLYSRMKELGLDARDYK